MKFHTSLKGRRVVNILEMIKPPRRFVLLVEGDPYPAIAAGDVILFFFISPNVYLIYKNLFSSV
jgi:hypothetical protein